MDQTKAALAAGIAGGYLLGRSRKAKLAFAVATYVVGRRFPLTPRHLVGEGARRLREHPRYGEISDRVSEDLLAAGRNVVTVATTSRLDALSDALRQSAHALEGVGSTEDDPELATEGAPEQKTKTPSATRERPARTRRASARQRSGTRQAEGGLPRASERA
ncbi:hypothetical protein [Streptomyces otsuchiensis]|uniref:hypothetical protein n=1 Tax=Streptomyces otsuchiensis TaxID=2681388 RepID=UPI001031C2CA|nr:hypothetical protein [Streptomyces otsuchiensis]